MSEPNTRVAEVEFLLNRVNGGSEMVGISSNALVLHVFSGEPLAEHNYPRDRHDLNRCKATVALLPEHLRSKGYRVLDQYVAWLRQGCSARGGCEPGLRPNPREYCWKCGEAIQEAARV